MSTFDVTYAEPELGEIERILLLRSFFPDEEGDGAAWELLSRRAVEQLFSKGQLIRRQGTDRLYFMVRGRIAVVHDGQVLREFGPGELLGMVDAMTGRQHAYDLLVEEESLVLEVLYDDWLEFIEDHFELACRGILRLAAALPPTGSPAAELGPSSVRRLAVAKGKEGTGRAPAGERPRLSAAERLAVLRACPPLSRAALQALARLAHYSTTIDLAADEHFTATAPALYVVETGRLRSTASVSGRLGLEEELGRGAALGGLALLATGPVEVQAVALEPSSLFRIPTERIFDVMEDHFSLTSSLLTYIASEMEAALLGPGGRPGARPPGDQQGQSKSGTLASLTTSYVPPRRP